jgi:hypothetical protein
MTRKHLFAAALLCAAGYGPTAMAQEQPQAPATPEAAATVATTPAVTEANVTFTSHPGNSISPNYHVDFAAMDANNDGRIVRAEASGNPDLMREFHVVDSNHDGRLTREEMKGWLD